MVRECVLQDVNERVCLDSVITFDIETETNIDELWVVVCERVGGGVTVREAVTVCKFVTLRPVFVKLDELVLLIECSCDMEGVLVLVSRGAAVCDFM